MILFTVPSSWYFSHSTHNLILSNSAQVRSQYVTLQLKSPPKQWKRVGRGGRKQLRWMIRVQEWGAIDDAWRESRLLGSTVNFTVEHPKLTGST